MALLQSKEEILEAINADIVSNGKKGITGDILNLIFNSIVALMGTGSGGGGNVYNLPLSMMTAGTPDAPYTFSAEEAAAFKDAVSKMGDTTFGLFLNEGQMQAKLTFTLITPTTTEDGTRIYNMLSFMAYNIGTIQIIPMTVVVTIHSDGSVSGYPEVM